MGRADRTALTAALRPFLGGGGRRTLTLAPREAHSVGFAQRTVDDLAEQSRELRAPLGISSLMVGQIDELAPIVERLAGI